MDTPEEVEAAEGPVEDRTEHTEASVVEPIEELKEEAEEEAERLEEAAEGASEHVGDVIDNATDLHEEAEHAHKHVDILDAVHELAENTNRRLDTLEAGISGAVTEPLEDVLGEPEEVANEPEITDAEGSEPSDGESETVAEERIRRRRIFRRARRR